MKPYNPELTEAEKTRKASFELWQRDKNDWVNQETGERRMWHPMAEAIGSYTYKAALKFIPNKKDRNR
jgi:hypothetical protein